MKISIRWVFDHIDVVDWSSVDIPSLVKLFNEKTAEIEQVESVAIDLKSFFIMKAERVEGTMVHGVCHENGAAVTIPTRTDLHIGSHYLIKKEADRYRWVTLVDCASAKDGLMPAISIDGLYLAQWQEHAEYTDVLFHLDNKSITHRPDLWGHRGCAREIAALLNLPFKDDSDSFEADFFARLPVRAYDTHAEPTDDNPFSLAIKDTAWCNRFAALYFDKLVNRPSSLWMALRLARIDARPIDFIVDATNYVMFDTSQPLHAFDADSIATRTLQLQRAHAGQKLALLDGQTIELTDHDLIISDGQEPLALAGVMGGKKSSVSLQTKRIFLESAHFDATAIRYAAARHKMRTEASARFEKTLDLNQNVSGIQRFVRILEKENISYTAAHEIVSLGATHYPKTIVITHDYIEDHIGALIPASFIIETLEKLSFGVALHERTYTITVPTFRATKDIGIKEDIVEEIARFYGYGSLPDCLPEKEAKAHSLEHVTRMRSIKQICAYSMMTRELYNYAFFDESFLAQLRWNPQQTVAVKNPVSENYRRLVSSLIPGLIKALTHNSAQQSLRFFEWGRTWDQHNNAIKEGVTLSAIFFDKKFIDFYVAKAALEQLFTFLEMSVEWQKIDAPEQPWWMPYQTAALVVDGHIIGTAGKIDPTFLQQVVEGDAFCFELDANFLLAYIRPQQRYQAPSKYPSVERDLSVLVPLRLTVRHIILAIKAVDETITALRLIDMFDKQEWVDQRALTFRFNIQAQDRTLTKEDAEAVWQKVVTAMQNIGVTVR